MATEDRGNAEGGRREARARAIVLNVGTNFDPALVDGLAALNDRYRFAGGERRVGELFGSLAGENPIGTARPDFRVARGDAAALRAHVRLAAARGMALNYAINASVVDPRRLKAREADVAGFLRELEDAGVARVIVAHPLVAELVRASTALPIELSTILQLRHPRQLELLCARVSGIDKLCLDVFANRNPALLTALAAAGRRLGVRLEALVNEFCVHECPDRNQCYDLHGLNLTAEETRLFGRYPMGRCIRQRIQDPKEWLRARFILPQWLRAYADRFGIATFKVSGRTHPTAYILRVAEAYLAGDYRGNLVELWADVENIGRLAEEYRAPRVDLDAGALGDAFLRAWFDAPGLTPGQEEAHLDRALARCLRRP